MSNRGESRTLDVGPLVLRLTHTQMAVPCLRRDLPKLTQEEFDEAVSECECGAACLHVQAHAQRSVAGGPLPSKGQLLESVHT